MSHLLINKHKYSFNNKQQTEKKPCFLWSLGSGWILKVSEVFGELFSVSFKNYTRSLCWTRCGISGSPDGEKHSGCIKNPLNCSEPSYYLWRTAQGPTPLHLDSTLILSLHPLKMWILKNIPTPSTQKIHPRCKDKNKIPLYPSVLQLLQRTPELEANLRMDGID